MTNLTTQPDKNGKAIHKGSIVRYQSGTRQQYVGRIENEDGSFTPQYETVPVVSTGRVTRLTSEWCNIGSVFSGKVYQDGKMIPLDNVVECEAEWYEAWTKSDQYRCM